jgi:hypothetical protein
MDTERFSQLGYKVTAIDLSDCFVEFTKKRVPSATVQKMDMRNLDFPEACFNGVWASFSLLHIRASVFEEGELSMAIRTFMEGASCSLARTPMSGAEVSVALSASLGCDEHHREE